MVSDVGLESPWTLGRVHATQVVTENPKREEDGQSVGQVGVEAEQGDRLK